MSFSQLGQDLEVVNFFSKLKNLYFVDIGANDGITFSNTYLLEKEYNWSGICSEPLPAAYEKLVKCRNVICDNNAVYSKSNETVEFSESDLYSGITTHIDKHVNFKNKNNVMVNTITLQDLLKKYDAPKTVHYLSLDTEGTELEILKSVDFNEYKFLLIHLEHNFVQPRRDQMKELLLKNGYVFFSSKKWDDAYIHESVILGNYYYDQNYTKTIQIQKIQDSLYRATSPYWKYSNCKLIKKHLNFAKRLGNGKLCYTDIDFSKGNCWHRDNRNNRYFCDLFINKAIKNKKGRKFADRFTDIISDPNNILIKRVKDAGRIIDDKYVIMHNGVKILKDCYYGNFSKCLSLNYGCHEPAEERMFQEVLNDIDENSTMIELGSYCCFYTIWFNTKIKNAKNYCVEPDRSNLEVGKKNCFLNNVNADFTLEKIGKDHLKISNFVKEKNIQYIDILHSDIQGFELELLEDIVPLLKNKQIKYLFISTHSDKLHYDCINLIKKCDYRIIASADFETQTFCYDGIIVACQKDNTTIKTTSLGNRKHTKLKTIPYNLNYY